tara:strand:+ start:700 stop:1368 length:669 start_codon:yes stop_codon:yes gene_type:complete
MSTRTSTMTRGPSPLRKSALASAPASITKDELLRLSEDRLEALNFLEDKTKIEEFNAILKTLESKKNFEEQINIITDLTKKLIEYDKELVRISNVLAEIPLPKILPKESNERIKNMDTWMETYKKKEQESKKKEQESKKKEQEKNEYFETIIANLEDFINKLKIHRGDVKHKHKDVKIPYEIMTGKMEGGGLKSKKNSKRGKSGKKGKKSKRGRRSRRGRKN